MKKYNNGNELQKHTQTILNIKRKTRGTESNPIVALEEHLLFLFLWFLKYHLFVQQK
jgi:hypothetical protein